ncbi:MAG: alpha/beta hydrolase-fold protein [Bacteroidota bacterium]
MRRILLCLTLLAMVVAAPLSAQMTIKVQGVPAYFTPLLDNIHIAGSFNLWSPGAPSETLQLQPDGSYAYTLNASPGQIVEYKFTRGDWATVETQASGAFLPNRSFVYNPGQTIVDTIAMWEDMAGNHTVVGNTRILDLDFNLPQLGRNRRIWVYLPQDYFTGNADYPVLYLHDGQNLFDVAYTAFGTEWAIDESMEMLQDSGYPPAIIVGVDNGGLDRINEYSPWVNLQYGGGEGDAYLDFLVNTLKPFIDGYFRTKPQREHTALMGSSLGGLITLYGGLQRQDIFSRLGVFSPSFWFDDSCYTQASAQGRQQAMRIYLLAGGQESPTMVPNLVAMEDTLLAAGFPALEVRTVVQPDGQHSEWFWAREFPEAYKWLFQPIATTLEPKLNLSPIQVALDPSQDSFFVVGRFHAPLPFAVDVYALDGKQVFSGMRKAGESIATTGWARGVYVVDIRYGTRAARQKILLR